MIPMQKHAPPPPPLVHAVSLAFDQIPQHAGQPSADHKNATRAGCGMEAREFFSVERSERLEDSDPPEQFAGFTTHAPVDSGSLRPQDSRCQELPQISHSIASARQHKELDPNDTIKVAVRVRPLLDYEKVDGARETIHIDPADPTSLKVMLQGPLGSTLCRDFHFHACLGQDVSQIEVLEQCSIPQLIDAALAGYNVTIMAYGQTGSGKTYTMSGREVVNGQGVAECKDEGIIMGAVQHLINAIPNRVGITCKLKASYLEIYNEGVYDLTHQRNRSLPVKWDARKGFHVPGLKVVDCSDMCSLEEVIATGIRNRRVGSHELNVESSRSHTILTIYCDSTPTDPGITGFGNTKFGKVSFVDLAGSERLKDTRSSGDVLKETTNINKSLFNLGKVISTLAERESAPGLVTHVPYRESVLTKLLMDSLGGSAFALMIACCSPAPAQIEETLSTLSYATRAKRIVNCPTVQYDPDEVEVIALRSEVELLREENVHLRGIIRGQDHVNLDHPDIQIAHHQLPIKQWSNNIPVGFDPTRINPLDKPSPSLVPPTNPIGDRLRRAGSAPSLKFPQLFDCDHPQNQERESIHGAEICGLDARSSMLSQQPKEQVPMTLAESRGQRRARLMDTHDILTQFTEENGRLARENERLRSSGERMLNSSQVLFEEITLLKNKLSQLESAVLSGDVVPRKPSTLKDESEHQSWQCVPPGLNSNGSSAWPNQDWALPASRSSHNPMQNTLTTREIRDAGPGRSSCLGLHRASIDGECGSSHTVPLRMQGQSPVGGRQGSGRGSVSSPKLTPRPSSELGPHNVTPDPKHQAPRHLINNDAKTSNPESESEKGGCMERLTSNSRASSVRGRSTKSNAGASVASPGRRPSQAKPKAPDEGIIVADQEGLSLLFASSNPTPQETIRQPERGGCPMWLAPPESISSQQHDTLQQGLYNALDHRIHQTTLVRDCPFAADHSGSGAQSCSMGGDTFHRSSSWDGSSYASQMLPQKYPTDHIRRNTEPPVVSMIAQEGGYRGGDGNRVPGVPLPFGVGPPGYAARYRGIISSPWNGNPVQPGSN